MPCRNCPKRSKCTEICPILERHLPSIPDTWLQGDREDDRMRSRLAKRKLSRLILSMRPNLPPKERAAVDLMLNSSLSLRGIARHMKITRSAAAALIRSARRRIVRIMQKRGRAAS